MRDGAVLREAQLPPDPPGSRPRHAAALLAEVERAAAAAGGWEAVERIAVGLGPGSYTGLRIGIATARGLAAALGIPVVGVPTLDALGRGICERGGGQPALAVIDARRGEVFAALYSPRGERLWDPLVAAPGELAERLAALPEAPLAAGSGALRFRDELAERGVAIPEPSDPLHRVAARHICALGAAVGSDAAERLDPIYLRPPDAKRWHERDAFQRAE